MKNKQISIDKGCIVIFVRRFQQDKEKVTLEDVKAVASNIGDVKEIVSVNVKLSANNQPGSFSITLYNHNDKFFVDDDVENEIKAINSIGKRYNIYTTLDVILKSEDNENQILYRTLPKDYQYYYPGNYYEYKDYNDFINKEIIILITKSGFAIPTYYLQNKDGNIIQRWAVDENGNLVILSNSNEEDKNLLKKLKENNDYLQDIEFVTYDLLDNNKKIKVKYDLRIERFKNLFKYINEKDLPINKKFRKGRCVIEPMDRVVIFLPRILPDNTVIAERVFTGIVSDVIENYSNNENFITITGEDVTKYLNLSIVNVNPSFNPLLSDINQLHTFRDYPTIWSSVIAGEDPIRLLKSLLITDEDIPFGKYGILTGVGEYEFTSSLPVQVVYNPDEDLWYINYKDGKVTNVNFEDALGILFKKKSVHIYDFFKDDLKIQGFSKYRTSFVSNFSFFENSFHTRRDLIYQFARDINYIFYADENGEIWICPIRLGIQHILSKKDPETYIINREDIISYNFSDTDNNLYTYITVTTEPDIGYSGTEQVGGLQGTALSIPAIIKYGFRIMTQHNPLIANPKKSDEIDNYANFYTKNAASYAKSLLQRILANKNQGNITIPGRPNLKIGNPVYIPIRNMVYFVDSITHDYRYGQGFTTSLVLSYGVKPYEKISEILTYSQDDAFYLSDSHILSEIVMNSKHIETISIREDRVVKNYENYQVLLSNKRVYEFKYNELYYNKLYEEMLIKYGQYFFDAEISIIKRELLMAICVLESSGGRNKSVFTNIGPAGELGIMQLTPLAVIDSYNIGKKEFSNIFKDIKLNIYVKNNEQLKNKLKQKGANIVDNIQDDIRYNSKNSIFLASCYLLNIYNIIRQKYSIGITSNNNIKNPSKIRNLEECLLGLYNSGIKNIDYCHKLNSIFVNESIEKNYIAKGIMHYELIRKYLINRSKK